MASDLKNIIENTPAEPDIRTAFLERIKDQTTSRDENIRSHFCVYFAAYDPEKRMVFIGRHIKSGLWLFNGGHLDKDESPLVALAREMNEEWGSSVKIGKIGTPKLLTITLIDNPIQPCKTHYDIWYFLPFDCSKVHPDQALLATEFHETAWKTFDEARKLIKDRNTLQGISTIEKIK
ncbi:MAG: NUDIX domain-containing protein [Candidatus Nealsonbacteria bacterium]|nr:NUDIX domain-containing protein [Candidatus Nealsonbacteria bacterium]